MLKRLQVKNLALISELELEFGDKLNILSGETGAGKSIVVDSLMLLLGAKYDKTLLRFGCDSGFVEGVFDITEKQRNQLSEFGIDDDTLLIVNRKFNADGKNEIRVNGKYFTATMLKNLMSSFVDIYGQGEYQSLSRPSEHLRILDYFVKSAHNELFDNVEKEYRHYKEIQANLSELGNLSERERNIDMYRYQIDEINNANISENEEESIVEKRRIFASSERLACAIGNAVNALVDGESGVTASEQISSALQSVGTVTEIKPIFDELYERLNSVSIEIEDIADTLVQELDNLDFDEREIDRIERRYDLILALKRKYGPYKKMMTYLAEAEEALDKLENCSELYEKLEREKNESVSKLYNLSVELSNKRKETAVLLSQNIMNELSELGMEHSVFEVKFNDLPDFANCENEFSVKGFDKPEFFLSPNIGQPLKPLIKIISGGEMSRFMLALKVITSRTDDIGTLIFDEIDAGISGKIGRVVGQKLARIARNHQVLCVTHLAQIAAMADRHFYISKYTNGDATFTDVDLLDSKGMIEEISRLSGGKDISSQAIDNASEMKKWSDDFKKNIEI